MRLPIVEVSVLLLSLAACGDSGEPSPDAGAADAHVTDARAADASPPDGGARVADARPDDTGGGESARCGDGVCNGDETCSTCDDCGSCSPPCAGGAPVSLGQHPVARTQPSATGRMMRETEGWNGRVYWGYGDYSDNTGPIPIVAYDPGTGDFDTLLTFATEEIARFRPIAGVLYAPATDPRGGQDWGYASGTPAHAWSAVPLAPAERPVHAYDIVERVPRDLYLTGSADAPHTYDYGTGYTRGGSTVWRSADGGETWEVILVANETASGFSRFYNVAALNGLLYVIEPGTSESWVWDGSTWTRGLDLPGFSSDPHFGRGKPVLFRDRLVWLSGSTLVAFDGTEITPVRSSVTVHELAEDRLLVVTAGTLLSTENLASWTCHGTAPDDTVSVGLLDGVPYFGGTDANIYGYDGPI